MWIFCLALTKTHYQNVGLFVRAFVIENMKLKVSFTFQHNENNIRYSNYIVTCTFEIEYIKNGYYFSYLHVGIVKNTIKAIQLHIIYF